MLSPSKAWEILIYKPNLALPLTGISMDVSGAVDGAVRGCSVALRDRCSCSTRQKPILETETLTNRAERARAALVHMYEDTIGNGAKAGSQARFAHERGETGREVPRNPTPTHIHYDLFRPAAPAAHALPHSHRATAGAGAVLLTTIKTGPSE